jgi:hypothetical protein
MGGASLGREMLGAFSRMRNARLKRLGAIAVPVLEPKIDRRV